MSEEKIIPDYAQPRLNLRPRFRPTWWAIASIVPLVAVAFVFLLPEPIAESLGVIVLAALVATVVYLLSGRRSFAANLAFTILVGTLTLVFAITAWLTSSLRADAIANNKAAAFSHVMRQAADAQNGFIDAGAITATNLDRPGELDHRIALLNQLIARMNDALKTGDNATADLNHDLQLAHILAWHRPRAIEKFERNTHWSYYAATLHVTLAFQNACADLLNFLRDHKTEWSIPPGTNNITFNSRDAKARMDALRQAIQNAAADVQGAPLKAARHASTTQAATQATTQMTTQPTNQSATPPRSPATNPSERNTSRSGLRRAPFGSEPQGRRQSSRRIEDPHFPIGDSVFIERQIQEVQS